jgi:hypothetical protein
MTQRKIIDCRDFPNEIGCTLLISGSIKEVFSAALRHSVEDHGHKDTPELRKQLKVMMKPEHRKKTNSKQAAKKQSSKK